VDPTIPSASDHRRARLKLDVLLSPERMAPYRHDANRLGVDVLDLYAHNMALAASLLGPLNVAEITVRNAMQNALTKLFDREDWWASAECALPRHHTRQIQEIQTRPTSRDTRTHLGTRPCDIVASVDFGFWTGLLGRGPDGHDYERELWVPALKDAFPNNRRDRGSFRKLVDNVRRLRNRVTHHEPLYRDQHRTLQRYADTLRVIEAVDKDMSRWVESSGTARRLLETELKTLVSVRF